MLRLRLALLLLCAPAFGAAGATPPSEAAAAERAFDAFIGAAQAGDRGTLARLADPVFVQHHGYGLTQSRAA